MKYLMYENLAVLLCAAVGFASGVRYLQNRKMLYASMIVMGVGCIVLGRLFQCARLGTGDSITDNFQVGILGTMGAFSFFFSANYGQFDSLVDDGSEPFRKYRLIALIAPTMVAVMYLQILLSPTTLAFRISCGIACAMIGAACYYHLKHIVIPDAEYGIVRCMKNYNAVALCLAVFSVVEMVAMAYGIEWLLITSGIGLCIITLLLVRVMDRGVKAWRT